MVLYEKQGNRLVDFAQNKTSRIKCAKTSYAAIQDCKEEESDDLDRHGWSLFHSCKPNQTAHSRVPSEQSRSQ